MVAQGLLAPFEEGIAPTDEVEVGVTSNDVVEVGVVSPTTTVDVDGLEDWSPLAVGEASLPGARKCSELRTKHIEFDLAWMSQTDKC